jgi:hypothetical protein
MVNPKNVVVTPRKRAKKNTSAGTPNKYDSGAEKSKKMPVEAAVNTAVRMNEVEMILTLTK